MMLVRSAVLALASFQAQADTAYFEQDVRYRIEARLDEDAQVLHARARMRYTNHSTRRMDTLYFHLHLNAFRPNSAWATRELESDNRRFQDLGPDEHAFERLTRASIAGRTVSPHYPGAPDSTVAALPLPEPIMPGDSAIVDLDWDARPSTGPRRQGRRGRHYDFAQWYPRIAVFDREGWQVQPLLPQGEFYGEFAQYDVTMDLAADQVVGATGVPVEGDPGWQGALAATSPEAPDLRRAAYPAGPAERLGLLGASAASGRKHVRWRAQDVHHFAWSTDPAYTYEGGRFEDVAIHVLYQPGDTAWDEGVAVRRTADALAFLDTIFGEYPWPQITNLHRIENGGTEFPMMVMDGSASEGLIMHEVGHNYVHGIFANNEWREGWLDEGFSSFLTNWFFASRGTDPAALWAGNLDAIRQLDRAGLSQPISLPSAEFRDFAMYGAMTYTKPALVFRMLREMVGDDVFRQGLHTYYDRHALEHVREADFRAAIESACVCDLGWFFQQWIHSTSTLDYRIESATTQQGPDGRWHTNVVIVREGDAWMPVVVRVGDTSSLAESRERSQTVTVTTATRPADVVLDPDNVLIDVGPANNRKTIDRATPQALTCAGRQHQ